MTLREDSGFQHTTSGSKAGRYVGDLFCCRYCVDAAKVMSFGVTCHRKLMRLCRLQAFQGHAADGHPLASRVESRESPFGFWFSSKMKTWEDRDAPVYLTSGRDLSPLSRCHRLCHHTQKVHRRRARTRPSAQIHEVDLAKLLDAALVNLPDVRLLEVVEVDLLVLLLQEVHLLLVTLASNARSRRSCCTASASGSPG